MLHVKLNRGKSKPFWLGHPWVYSGAVQGVTGEGADQGGPCLVLDERENVVGWGHYNPHARIAVRILEHRRTTDKAFEAPKFLTFMAERLAVAGAVRRELGLGLSGEGAYRLVNAEGDGLSGLIVDVYGDRAVMQLNSRGMAKEAEAIASLVMEQNPLRSVKALVSDHGARFEGIEPIDITFGETDGAAETQIDEQGVRFALDFRQPQKTGFYLDQRENRLLFKATCAGKSVLDLYCHAGGFGLHALGAGAASATFVGSSESAVQLVKTNLELNGAEGVALHIDAMTFLRQAGEEGRRWERIVCDPPKFVRGRGHREDGLKKYARLNMLALEALEPGGLMLTCSCSEHVSQSDFLRMLTEAAHRLRRSLRIHGVYGQAQDHPYMSVAPQSDYLKAALVSLA